MYGFFADLCRAAQYQRELGYKHQLLWWDMGILIQRRHYSQDRMHSLRPDALAAYLVGERIVRFWLEWDRQAMGLMEKLATYQHYICTREWSREHVPLPWLLVVVANHDQELHVASMATQQLATGGLLTLRMTTTSHLACRGPLGEIWLPVLPVQEARQGQLLAPRSRFFELRP